MLLSGFALLVLILQSRNVMEFASQGLDLCIRTLIPSLFPFFLISIYLTGSLSGGTGLLPVLVSGFLGGYPVGAQSVSESYRTGRISQERANCLLMFCSQAGPAFLFGIVSVQFPEQKYGWMLWGIQIVSALSVGLLIHQRGNSRQAQHTAVVVSFTYAMHKALRAMASVCGWVVIFRVILGFTDQLPIPNTWQVLVSGFLELSNGCVRLGTVENIPLRFLLGAVMLNFGGLCVMLQTASVIGTLDIRFYLLGKLLQTGFAILYCMIFFGYYSAIIPIIAVLLLRIPCKIANNSSIPARLGV